MMEMMRYIMGTMVLLGCALSLNAGLLDEIPPGDEGGEAPGAGEESGAGEGPGPGTTVEVSASTGKPATSGETPVTGAPAATPKTATAIPGAGFFVPGATLFSAPALAPVVMARKGTINQGNSGFAPIGEGGALLGVGYDRADNSASGPAATDYDGNEYRIHLELLKGHGDNFYGLAGEYRKAKYTLGAKDEAYETEFYGPRVDLGRKLKDSWVQLSGGYYFGNTYLQNTRGSSGHLTQVGLLAGMEKTLAPRLTLKPGVDVQYIWQKLGTIAGTRYPDRDYGRADFNLGLDVALNRGWSVTPNVGYRWDIKSACTHVDEGATAVCPPKGGWGVGLNFGLVSDDVMIDVGAYYVKKSGVKQSVWGVMAQYPF